MTSAPSPSREPSCAAPPPEDRVVRVPLGLLRFHQAMPEHGPAACPHPIGQAPPAGHVRFRSTSE